MPNTRICVSCSRTLPLTEFYHRKDTNDGYRKECKNCYSKRNRRDHRRRSLDKEYIEYRKLSARDWRYANTHRKREYDAKYKKKLAKPAVVDYSLDNLNVKD